MFRSFRVMIALTLLVLPAGAALAQQVAPAAGTPEGLQQRMTDIYAATRARDAGRAEALIKQLRLPAHSAWFGRTFGEATGSRLAAEYDVLLQRFDVDAANLFAGVVQKGQSEIQVLRLASADDPNAVGNQRDAIAAMKVLQELYSVRFVQPGMRLGVHLYSFVYSEGEFRFVGRMAAAKP